MLFHYVAFLSYVCTNDTYHYCSRSTYAKCKNINSRLISRAINKNLTLAKTHRSVVTGGEIGQRGRGTCFSILNDVLI